jgi:hypothetical protein
MYIYISYTLRDCGLRLQYAAVWDAYVAASSVTPASLTAADIQGLGNVLCGISATDMANIPTAEVR